MSAAKTPLVLNIVPAGVNIKPLVLNITPVVSNTVDVKSVTGSIVLTIKKPVENTFTSRTTDILFTKNESTLSITFGDVAENHTGMQKIGSLLSSGFTLNEIENKLPNSISYDLTRLMDSRGGTMFRLCVSGSSKDFDVKSNAATLVVIKGGLNSLLGAGTADKLFEEMKGYDYDKKAFMRGRVVNKKARWTGFRSEQVPCFADFSQEPNYEKAMGTVIDFNKTQLIKQIRDKLSTIFGDKANKLMAETNLYYDVNKTYIGFHGDTERRIVICIRLGADFPMHFQWYHKCESVGKRFTTVLSHGDIYIMSDKAVGYDWKKRNIYTLRHAAGYEHVLKLPKELTPRDPNTKHTNATFTVALPFGTLPKND